MAPQLPVQPASDVELVVEQSDPLAGLRQAVEEFKAESEVDFDFDQENVPSLVSDLDTDLRAFDEAEFGTMDSDIDSFDEEEPPVPVVDVPAYELSW